jgi:hypothetical protein
MGIFLRTVSRHPAPGSSELPGMIYIFYILSYFRFQYQRYFVRHRKQFSLILITSCNFPLLES